MDGVEPTDTEDTAYESFKSRYVNTPHDVLINLLYNERCVSERKEQYIKELQLRLGGYR